MHPLCDLERLASKFRFDNALLVGSTRGSLDESAQGARVRADLALATAGERAAGCHALAFGAENPQVGAASIIGYCIRPALLRQRQITKIDEPETYIGVL